MRTAAAKCFLLYGGRTPLYQGDISVLPIRQALKGLDAILRM